MAEKVDVVVIGTGQAGLAAGSYLKQTSLSFVLLDSSEQIGNSWRNRYDALLLFNRRSFCALPGLNVTGDPPGISSMSSSQINGIGRDAERIVKHIIEETLEEGNLSPAASLEE